MTTIDKIRAEIERRRKNWLAASRLVKKGKDAAMYAAGKSSAYTELLSFLDTLQEPEVDLEKEIDLGWHSVDESLPPVDEEVIVLTDHLDLGCFHRIGFGHIVNQETTVGIDGKPYKPISHDGWNIPAVKYWMPMPKLKEEEE